MNSTNGLVLGMELKNETSQLYLYDSKLETPMPVIFGEKQFIKNPVTLYDMANKDSGGNFDENSLYNLIAIMLSEVVRQNDGKKIVSLGVVVHDMSITILEAIKNVLKRMGFTDNQWQILGKSESFAYYAYSQRIELYRRGVGLLDYGDSGIKVSRMDFIRKNNNDYIYEDNDYITTESILNCLKNKDSLDTVSAELCEYINDYFSKKTASAIYLTGEGFDVEKLPDNLTKTIINGRRAFIGQNLYVKGACFAALEQINPNNFKNTFFLCSGRTRVGLETEIVEHGVAKRLIIIRPGVNWFMAERDMDFILQGEREIRFRVVKIDGSSQDISVDISDIPYREPKTTRISLNVKFDENDVGLITIKDKGFGDFIKSSGQVIYKELRVSDFM